VLVKHRDISEAAVIGIPDKKWGEVPAAVIVSESASEHLNDELTEFCRSKMAAYKIPKHFQYVSELPRNAAGKINKSLLRDEFVIDDRHSCVP